MTAGPNGALWFANYGNSTIGEITTTGTVSHFSDPSISKPVDITTGPDGALWFTNQGNNSIGRITTGGAVTNFTNAGIVSPYAITLGPARRALVHQPEPGRVELHRRNHHERIGEHVHGPDHQPLRHRRGRQHALDHESPGRHGGSDAIEKMSSSGAVSHVYTDPSLIEPAAIVVGSDSALWFVNNGNASIGRITTSGAISNYTDPTIDGPIWIAAGSDGALWFSNQTNNSIGRITTSVTPEIKAYPDIGLGRSEGTITGKNLDGASQVAVNGTKEKIVSDTATQLVMKLKAGTTTGPITVTTPDGTADIILGPPFLMISVRLGNDFDQQHPGTHCGSIQAFGLKQPGLT